MKKRIVSIATLITLMIGLLVINLIPASATAAKIGWSANPTSDSQKAGWEYFGRDADKVDVYGDINSRATCQVSFENVTANAYDGVSFDVQFDFTDKADADAACRIGYKVTVDLDETPYLYFKRTNEQANSWYSIYAGERLDNSPNIYGDGNIIGDTSAKKFDLTTLYPAGGTQTFFVVIGPVDGSKAGAKLSFGYFFIGNEEADPDAVVVVPPQVNTTDDPNIAWSASMSADDKTGWNYFGKNTAGNIVSSSFTNLGSDCPVSITDIASNNYQGAGFTAKLSFPSGSQAEPFQAIGRNVVIDVDETPYLYIDTSGYAANTWIELRIGNSISDTSLLDTITESTIKKYDLRETFPEGGVQSFCIAMTLIDGGKIGHGFSFNYLFIGNEAADPANSTAASDIGWSADIGAQKSKWNYFGKNTAGTVVSQNFNNLDANCPLIITTGEANEYDGTAFNVKFNWTDDSEADFYQRIGYQVTLDTSIYSKLYFKADFGKNDVIELLLCEDVGSIPMFSNPAMNSDLGMRTIDLDTVFETPGTHTFWVVLSFHDMNYDGSDFDVEYLFIGTEAAKPDEEEEDPDKETGGQTDPEDDAEITLTDGATNVKVTGNLDADTVLNVTEITAGTDYDFVAGYMKSVSPKWEAYDVQLTLYGFPVSLTEDIVYSFPIPSTIGAEDAVIYYLADDGTLTLIDSFTEDGLLNVTTKLMGIFMIAEKSGSSTDIPATGDPIAVWPLVAVIISAGCMALLIRGRRKVS